MGVGLRTYSSSLRLDQNKLATSLKACLLALDVARASGDQDNEGLSYMYLFGLYRDMGWWDDALSAYERFAAWPRRIRHWLNGSQPQIVSTPRC